MGRSIFNLVGLFFVLLISVAFVSGVCEDWQVDINSASAVELDEIIWVGSATAEKIIAGRDFENVDALIRVYGIGEMRLGEIKNQGLACVEVEIVIEAEEVEEPEPVVEEEEPVGEIVVDPPKDKETETISLTAETIKSPEVKDKKSNYALYGFVGFCVLICALLVLRRNKYKNEFRGRKEEDQIVDDA